MLPPYAPQENTSTIANAAAPSPSLLQPLLSNTSSSSSVSTISARIKSGSVGSLGVASASSSEFYFNGPDVGNEQNAGPPRQLHVVGSPLVRRNVTPDGQLHAARFARSRIVLPRSPYHLASPKVGNVPSKSELSVNIGAAQYSISANTKTPNESTTSAPSLPDKTSSIMSRKIHRHGASSILGLGSSSIAAITNRHRHGL